MPLPLSAAGACCAYLMRDLRVRFGGSGRARVPAIVVSEATQGLLCDVFQKPDLFRGLPRIERRIVAWGKDAAAVELPHRAVVISEEALAARLAPEAMPSDEDAAWTVFAARPLPAGVGEQHFGSRRAFAVAVDLAGSACWVESVESGWLFLIPGWLIAVGDRPEALLAQSRLVASQIHGVTGEAAEFPAYPHIADPLCGPGWLACGSAAMAFDPICGDGTGNAVREAILAAAVIRAAGRGENVEELLAHYQARLTAGFRRHLAMSREFYRAGNEGPWWDEELRGLERGLEWCGPPAEFRYRLSGFELEKVDQALE